MRPWVVCLGLFVGGGCVATAAASPVPDYECKGGEALIKTAVPGWDVGGDFIYGLGDEEVGLVGYAEPKERLALDGASGEGARFSNGVISFFRASEASGLQSALQVNATGASVPCISTVVKSNLSQAGERGWVDGIALITIIRDQPSVSGKRLDKLPEGEPLAILRNVGNTYQDYDWFEVEYSEGLKGFAWGGTVCSRGSKLKGIATQCEEIGK